jgi:hypothetical protein
LRSGIFRAAARASELSAVNEVDGADEDAIFRINICASPMYSSRKAPSQLAR